MSLFLEFLHEIGHYKSGHKKDVAHPKTLINTTMDKETEANIKVRDWLNAYGLNHPEEKRGMDQLVRIVEKAIKNVLLNK